MFIETERTANPARMKFRPDCSVLSAGTAGFLDAAASVRSPLAQRLFEVNGVKSVYLDSQTITVTKFNDIDSPMFKTVILGAIMEHFSSGNPVIHDEDQPMPKPGLDTEDGIAIRDILDHSINPKIASHGGYISLVDVQEDTVFIRMEGGCQGCGMADVTLKQGVATEIKSLVPNIIAVLDVTDHAGGTNPYHTTAKGASSPFHQPAK
jgi:Fe-S cluster biogenesis protein NfuA